MDTDSKLHQCNECGLHYLDEAMANKCETFCKMHNACSLEITRYSLENVQRHNSQT